MIGPKPVLSRPERAHDWYNLDYSDRLRTADVNFVHHHMAFRQDPPIEFESTGVSRKTRVSPRNSFRRKSVRARPKEALRVQEETTVEDLQEELSTIIPEDIGDVKTAREVMLPNVEVDITARDVTQDPILRRFFFFVFYLGFYCFALFLMYHLSKPYHSELKLQLKAWLENHGGRFVRQSLVTFLQSLIANNFP